MDKKFEINLEQLYTATFKEPLKKGFFNESKNIFNIFDINKDGEIDENEIFNVFQQFSNYSSRNSNDKKENASTIFDEVEAKCMVEQNQTKEGKTYAQLGVTISEVFNFLNTLLNNISDVEKINEEEPTTSFESFTKIDKTTEEDPFDEEQDQIKQKPIELTEEQKKNAAELSNIPERGEHQFSKEECEQLAQLTPEELNEAKKYFNIETRDKQLSASEIIFIVRDYKEKFNIPEENLSRLPELLILKDKNNNEMEVKDIMSLLANKTSQEVDKVFNLLKGSSKEFDIDFVGQVNFIVRSKSSYLYNLAINRPDITLTIQRNCSFINSDIREAIIDGKTYRFISGQELPEEISDERIGNNVIRTIHNPNMNVTQILSYYSLKPKALPQYPDKIETRHLDKDGNVEYTEFYEDGEIPGTKNIYIIDKNGNKTDIQKSTVNHETGIQTIIKNYVDNDITTQFKLTANPSTNEYDLNYEIHNPDEEKPLFCKHQSLKQISENSFVYDNNGKTYNITVTKNNDSENGVMHITDNSQNKTYDISLNKMFQNEDDKVIMARFIRMPAEMLVFLSEHPLENINYGNFIKNDNGHFDKEKNLIEFGNQVSTKSDTELKDTVFSILMHEFGHFLDYNIGETIDSLSTNQEFQAVFQDEVKIFKHNHTSEEQNIIGYFTGATTMEGISRGYQEAVAEINMLTNTVSKEVTSTRAYYLQRYFPRTIAFVTKMIHEELQK